MVMIMMVMIVIMVVMVIMVLVMIMMIMVVPMTMPMPMPMVMAKEKGHEEVDHKAKSSYSKHEGATNLAGGSEEAGDGLKDKDASEEPYELDGDEGAKDLDAEEPIGLPWCGFPASRPEGEEGNGKGCNVREKVGCISEDG